jgi:peptidoglycan/LPS O-acetylase OafA/YrhL
MTTEDNIDSMEVPDTDSVPALKRETLRGVDLFKLLAAVLIVYMHTYCSDLGVAGQWVKDVLSTACVPFFFICSGYFFRRGMDRSLAEGGEAGEAAWFKRYLLRLVKMYLAWSLLTLPVSFLVIERGHPDFSVFMKALYQFRLFFLTGSIGIYWYILALILCTLIIRWCRKRGLTGWLAAVSAVLFLYGCLYNSPVNHQQKVFEIIHVLFGSERNFLNVGLFFILAGFMLPAGRLASMRRKPLLIVLLAFSVLVRTWESRHLGTNFTQALIAMAAFFVAATFRFDWLGRMSQKIRHLSIGLYVLHFPFILLFDFYLRRGTVVDFPAALAFSVAVFYFLSLLFPAAGSVLFGYSRK